MSTEANISHSDGADVTIDISDDGMTAVIGSYTQPASDEGELDGKVLARRMKDAGIHDTDNPHSEKVLLMARLGKDITGMPVANGRPPQEPLDAKITFQGDMAYPVFHGDAFAKLRPARKPSPGATVTGAPVLPASDRKPEDIALGKHSGCELDEETMMIRAKRYGLVDYRQKKLLLKPLIKIAPDNLLVSGTVYPLNFLSDAITLDMFKRELWAMDVRTFAEKAVHKAITTAQKKGEPVENATLAKGIPAKDGKDGRFEVLFTGDEGLPDADSLEDIDPRERSIFKPIKEGTIIGRLVPPVEGRFGRDVYGEDLVPAKGKPAETKAGENVEVSPDGVEFKAAISGMITWQGNRVSVLEMVHVPGNVSYATGNLKLETGSVLIDGSVNDGFSVTAPGDICVGGAVEKASLASGGNIGVAGGLIMGGEGRVRAKGDVSCAFGEGATVVSGGNVEITHHLSTCDIEAKGRVICTRSKGTILGGRIKAGRGIEANEIGSDMGVKTHVTLDPGVEVGGVKKLVSERMALRDQKSQLDAVLGTESPKAVLVRTPPAKRAQIAELLKKRIAVISRLDEIEKALEERRVVLERLKGMKVKIHRAVHPGTVITIADKKMTLHEPEGPCEFYYDGEAEKVVMKK